MARLEHIGMVENPIGELDITDLADLMRVSEQLPPVLMREYRAPGWPRSICSHRATLPPCAGSAALWASALAGRIARRRRRQGMLPRIAR